MPRRRSEEAHQKVLEAAMLLFAERGIDNTTMDSVAEASGVSKATIYKHWQDKDALFLDTLVYLHRADEEPPVFDSGDFRADLIAQLNYQPARDRREIIGRIMPHLIAYSARNRTFAEHWKARILERPRYQLREMLLRGIKRNELVKTLDLEVAIALLIGPMFYRRVFENRFGYHMPEDLADHAVDAFLAAYGVQAKKR
jgi:AcrR family transcriptional regulator